MGFSFHKIIPYTYTLKGRFSFPSQDKTLTGLIRCLQKPNKSKARLPDGNALLFHFTSTRWWSLISKSHGGEHLIVGGVFKFFHAQFLGFKLLDFFQFRQVGFIHQALVCLLQALFEFLDHFVQVTPR